MHHYSCLHERQISHDLPSYLASQAGLCHLTCNITAGCRMVIALPSAMLDIKRIREDPETITKHIRMREETPMN